MAFNILKTFLLLFCLFTVTSDALGEGKCGQINRCGWCLHKPGCYGSYFPDLDQFRCHDRKAETVPKLRNGTKFILQAQCCPGSTEFNSNSCGYGAANPVGLQIWVPWNSPWVWGPAIGAFVAFSVMFALSIYACKVMCTNICCPKTNTRGADRSGVITPTAGNVNMIETTVPTTDRQNAVLVTSV